MAHYSWRTPCNRSFGLYIDEEFEMNPPLKASVSWSEIESSLLLLDEDNHRGARMRGLLWLDDNHFICLGGQSNHLDGGLEFAQYEYAYLFIETEGGQFIFCQRHYAAGEGISIPALCYIIDRLVEGGEVKKGLKIMGRRRQATLSNPETSDEENKALQLDISDDCFSRLVLDSGIEQPSGANNNLTLQHLRLSPSQTAWLCSCNSNENDRAKPIHVTVDSCLLHGPTLKQLGTLNHHKPIEDGSTFHIELKYLVLEDASILRNILQNTRVQKLQFATSYHRSLDELAATIQGLEQTTMSLLEKIEIDVRCVYEDICIFYNTMWVSFWRAIGSHPSLKIVILKGIFTLIPIPIMEAARMNPRLEEVALYGTARDAKWKSGIEPLLERNRHRLRIQELCQDSKLAPALLGRALCKMAAPHKDPYTFSPQSRRELQRMILQQLAGVFSFGQELQGETAK